MSGARHLPLCRERPQIVDGRAEQRVAEIEEPRPERGPVGPRVQTGGVCEPLQGSHEHCELEVAIGYLAGAYVLGLEDPGSRMARLGALLTTTGAIRPVEEQLARWRAVRLDDVARVVARVLDQPRSMAVVGPVSEGSVRGKPRPRSA